MEREFTGQAEGFFYYLKFRENVQKLKNNKKIEQLFTLKRQINEGRTLNKMAWEKPKTDWQTGDAPTADAFNRIEKNILDLKDNKRDKSSTVPVANGGTGATNKNWQKISPEQRSGQNIRQKIENNKSN